MRVGLIGLLVRVFEGLVLRPWVGLASLGWTDRFVSSGLIECLGFSSGPIRMVFMLFNPLTAKAINFLRNGSGPIGFVLRPWRVGLIVLLVLVLVRVRLGWSFCYLDAGREKQSIF